MSQPLDAKSLLERFDISPEDLALLKRCGQTLVSSNKIESVIEQFYEWLGEQPEFSIFFNSQDTVDRVKKLRHVRLWHLADIDSDAEHVCFQGESGNRPSRRVRQFYSAPRLAISPSVKPPDKPLRGR